MKISFLQKIHFRWLPKKSKQPAPMKKCAESKYLLNTESLFPLCMEMNLWFVYCLQKESLFILLPSIPFICWSSYWAGPNHKVSVYIRQMFTGNRKSMSVTQLYCVFRLHWAHLLEKQCFVSLYLYFIIKNKCPLQVMDHLYCHSIAMCFTDVCKWILGWTPFASEP